MGLAHLHSWLPLLQAESSSISSSLLLDRSSFQAMRRQAQSLCLKSSALAQVAAAVVSTQRLAQLLAVVMVAQAVGMAYLHILHPHLAAQQEQSQ